jgi:hypothetical protein
MLTVGFLSDATRTQSVGASPQIPPRREVVLFWLRRQSRRVERPENRTQSLPQRSPAALSAAPSLGEAQETKAGPGEVPQSTGHFPGGVPSLQWVR